jgi:hypothetical protein
MWVVKVRTDEPLQGWRDGRFLAECGHMRDLIRWMALGVAALAVGCGNPAPDGTTTNTGGGGNGATTGADSKPTKFPDGTTWAFVTNFDNGPAVVLESVSDATDPGAVDGWSFGDPRHVTDDGIYVVEIDVNEKALPPQLQGWAGWEVQLLTSSGQQCAASLDRLELMAVVDMGDDDAAELLGNVIDGTEETERPALVWSFEGSQRHLTMTVSDEEKDACKHPVAWAVPAGRDVGSIRSASSAPTDIDAKAQETFRGLQEYWDVQRDFQKIEGDDPTPVIPDPDKTPDDFIGWWHEWDQFGSLEVDIVRVDDDEMLVLAYGRAGDGCCSNPYSLDVLWRVSDGQWTQLAAVHGLFFGYQLVGAVDVDGDGSRDLMFEGPMGMLGVWFQTDGKFEETEFLSTARNACNPRGCLGF